MRQTDIAAQGKHNQTYKRRRRRKQPYITAFHIVFTAVFIILFLASASVIFPDKFSGINSMLGRLAATEKLSPTLQPITSDRWKLILVNQKNPLPKDFYIETITLKNGLQVDKRCYHDLQDMMEACRAAGFSPVICSAYRTQKFQEQLYQKKVDWYLDKGYDKDSAEAEAGKEVAIPGTSEHQLGLALDIVDSDNQNMDESQESTSVQKWLMEYSWKYGFILRYPSGKSSVTGIIYEPWHYRYVGKEDAAQIHAAGVCLEEYLGGNS